MNGQCNIFLPKSISQNAIISYIITLSIVFVLFSKFAMTWYFMLFGLMEVVGFYYYGNLLSKQYCSYSEKYFKHKIFLVAFVVRAGYVILSYVFYDVMTGRPFEFGMADSEFYHTTAVSFSLIFSEGDFNFFKLVDDVDFSDLGYVVYLGFVYWIFFDSIIIVRLLKALMSAYMCVLIYNLAKRNFGEQVGRLSAVFAVLCPNLIYYCGMHLKETEMVFVAVLAIERFDEVFRGGRITWKSLIVPFIMLILTFTLRTALGLSILFAIGVNIFICDKSVISTSRKWFVMAILTFVFGLFLWGKIMPQIEDMWKRKDNQQANMEWRARRTNGNQFAKYAGATVFAPLIFSIPFPTMVEITTQEDQQMVNGNNYVKNILSFFTILSLFMIFFKRKSWRKHVFMLAYIFAYLGILVFSEFAHSERFHMPTLPIELIFAAFGISALASSYKKSFNVWCVIMICAAIAWNWFKLAGRGLI